MKTASLEQLQLVGRFETFSRLLSAERYARHRERPLAYWALPSDRRLPLAFLGRTLGEILQTPYAELAATPGIGRKKMRSLMTLLDRAARTDAADLPTDLAPSVEERRLAAVHGPKVNGFDASAVSELIWDQWRASVVRHGFGKELLGRLAPSLRDLSRVIWHTPLEHYAEKTLAELRALKTHGEKRVGAILQVFYGIHAVVAQVGPQDQLAVCVAPRRIDAAERWVRAALQRPGIPHRDEIFASFLEPLLEQIRCDASEPIIQLAESRLGVHGPVASVRQAARGLGLTRARIYQLLGEIHAIMSVRWPLGRCLVHELRDKFWREHCEGGTDSADLEPFLAAVELFFPPARRNTLAQPEGDVGNRSLDSSEVDFDREARLAKCSRPALARSPLPR
jgi:hypothetical protein